MLKQKTPKSTKKSSQDILNSAGVDETFSQTVDNDIVTKTPSDKQKRKRKKASSQSDEQQDAFTTPKRSSQQQGTEGDQDVDDEIAFGTAETPKRGSAQEEKKSTKKKSSAKPTPSKSTSRKDTPKPSTGKASSSTDSKKRKATSESKKATPAKKIKTANGEFTEKEIETFESMRSSENALPKAAFLRILKDAVRKFQPEFRVSRDAFEVLLAATENEMSDLFFVANSIALASNRMTVNLPQLQLATAVKKVNNTGLHMHTTFDMKKFLSTCRYSAESIAAASENVDLIAQQGMHKLELIREERNRELGLPAPKKKRSKDDDDEDYERTKSDRDSTRSSDQNDDEVEELEKERPEKAKKTKKSDSSTKKSSKKSDSTPSKKKKSSDDAVDDSDEAMEETGDDEAEL